MTTLNAPLGPGPARTLKGLHHTIGNTPLLAIHFTLDGDVRTLHVKSEQMNMTGSIKDRMALHILETAYRDGTIRPGDTIAEATSGNTGISFSAIGRALGHPVRIFMPDWMSRERVDLIRSLGAEIVPVSAEQGGFVGSIRLSEDYAAANEHVFLPRQFANEGNVRAHEMTTGPEIWWQLQFQYLKPDAFVAGVGTGGAVMGVGRFLRQVVPGVRIYPLEPAESPTLRTGCKLGRHRIQGISDEFIPHILDLSSLDPVVDASDGDAILMAQQLAARLGLGVGISSGANFLGAVKVQESLGRAAIVATVFPDDNKKYLSTGLLKEEPVAPEYLTPRIRLLGYDAYKRVCHTCCDFDDCTQRLTTSIPQR